MPVFSSRSFGWVRRDERREVRGKKKEEKEEAREIKRKKKRKEKKKGERARETKTRRFTCTEGMGYCGARRQVGG